MKELRYNEETEVEMLPLIDESGEVVGRASRRYCHSQTHTLHPVVHLHILDSDGRVYLQKRSMKKDIAPGLWDTSVGGHVDYGESLLQAVVREAREEVGLYVDCDNLRLAFQYIWKSECERELVTAYVVEWEGQLHPDRNEVDEGRFFTLEELEGMLDGDVLTEQFKKEEFSRLKAYLC